MSAADYIPRVSIAMATFNGEKFLSAQIDSILEQSFPDLELVVVDDGSTDGTRDILENYQRKDERVRLYFNESNTGYRSVFYKAISECKADFILFSDQDDWWKPKKVENLLENITDNLLVFSDSELMNGSGQLIGKKLSDTVNMIQPGDEKINRGFVIGNCVWGHTILFHRSLLKHIHHPANNQPHDWWFAVVSSHLHKIKFCPEMLNHYRQHTKNLTQAIPTAESKRKKIEGRKQEEFETQIARLTLIKDLPSNDDKRFYEKWHELFLRRKKGFSLSLFFFLLKYRKDIFCMKRKNFLSQLIAIRKMCRQVNA